jgi:cell division protease FtsH
MMKMRSLCGISLAGVFLLTIPLAACSTPPQGTRIALSRTIELSKAGRINDAVLDPGNNVIVTTAKIPEDSNETATTTAGPVVSITDGMRLISDVGGMNFANLQDLGFVLPVEYSTAPQSTGPSIYLTILPYVLLAGLLLLMLRPRGNIQSQTLSIARSKARLVTGNRPAVTFTDIAGEEEAKEDLQEVVQALKSRWKFQAMGATIPKGVLLVGPPGTGKTLLARAVAGEASVPFFSASGSEFVEIFVGVGAARVRDLFEQAKRSAPSIVFIDEIDAVGRLRSGTGPGGHEEREQTLNQILVEMDGFDPNIGVIVLAATNRPDTLDPALLRPGRFDRRVLLELPDTNGRTAILNIHAKGKKLEESVDLSVIAKQTHGFSGADLANVMNEAAILAIRRARTAIGMKEIDDAIDRVIAGPERKSLRVNPRDKETTAYHEAGHALVAHMLPNVDPVHKISIVARGSMGGYTRLAQEDRYFITKSQCMDTLSTLLAGHVSEELVFSEVSTGPHSDITQATSLARKMVTDYGMSQRLGVRTYGMEASSGFVAPPRDYSEETARQIDAEVSEILKGARQAAQRILQENRDRLAYIAGLLLEEETLEGDRLEAAFSSPVTKKMDENAVNRGAPARHASN